MSSPVRREPSADTPRPAPAANSAATSAPRATRERWALFVAGLAVVFCAFLLAASPTRSDDIFMHLAVGRRFFETGSFPETDPWLFSIENYPRRWIDIAYWGMHLGAAKLYALGGFELLSAVKTALVVCGSLAPLWLARRLGLRSFLVPAALLVGLWAACDRFIERGSLVSDCLGPWVIAITAAELVRPSKLRWLLPPLVLVWTNLHPGVATGLAFIGCGAASQPKEWRRWLPVVLACGVAAVAHPDGARHLLWALQSAPGGGQEAFRRYNAEQMPTFSPAHIGMREVWIFVALAAFVLLVLVRAFARGARPWFATAVFAALVYMGTSTIRFVSTASLALPVVLVSVLATPKRAPVAEPRVRKRARGARAPGEPEEAAPAAWRAHAPFAASLATAAVALGIDARVLASGYTSRSGHHAFGFGLQRSLQPFAAADFVRALPGAPRIFNDHVFGTFLAWYWDAQPRIYFHGYVLDARFYLDEYVAISKSAADFDRIVKQHDIDVFFMRRVPATATSGPLVYRLLLTRPEWHLVWWDNRALVFVKDEPAMREIIAANEFRYLDPFRLERVDAGVNTNRVQLLDEALRQLERVPDSEWTRNLVRQLTQRDPDELLRARSGR
jgi:hypothetical protein